jgi:FMN-dependent NADH-azoreductase
MSKLLHLDSSGKGSMSVSKPLTAYFAEHWKKAHSGGTIVYRDLTQSNLHFVSPELVQAFYAPEGSQSDEQKSLLKLSDQLVAELLEADEYLFGVPMYNFSVPAIFKAYIDLIARAGKTFSYQGGAPKGLLQHKKLFLVTTSGGDYSDAQRKGYDFVEPYIRALWGFLGISDITFIKAHGTNPETIQQTSDAAKREIDSLFASVAR